jgi:rhomboid protease GluP
MGTYMDIRTSGKTNNELNFDYYVVIPFLRSELIGESPDPHRSFAIKFHKQISTRASQLEKEQTVAALLVKANADLRSYHYRNPDHFKRVRSSEKLELYKIAAGFSRLQLNPEQIIFLEPQDGSYANRTGRTLYWGIGFLLTGSIIITMFLIFTGFDKAEYRRQLNGEKPANGDLEDMLKFLWPSGNHFVTSMIMDLIILVFLIMTFSGVSMISPRGGDLMAWGANRRPEVLNGEWWRLLTSIFLHGGIMHLVSNIIGLALAAIFVEPRMGRKKYALLFLVSGIAGSLVSIAWHDRNPSVGASGAIFGLYGALIALALLKRLPADENKFALGFAGIFVGINLLYGLTGNIDNAAHLGGLFAGGVAGVLLYKPPPVIKTKRLRRKTRVGGHHSRSVT